jgi:hypothetical protein
VKLKTQRNARKRTNTTRPNACSPKGPIRNLEIAACAIVHVRHEWFKTIVGTFTLAEYIHDHNLNRRVSDEELVDRDSSITEPINFSA